MLPFNRCCEKFVKHKNRVGQVSKPGFLVLIREYSEASGQREKSLRWWLVFVLCLGLILRLVHLFSNSLWGDEIIVARTLQGVSLREAIQGCRTMVAGAAPLDHVWMWLFCKLFPGDTGMLIPPLLFGVASLGALSWAATPAVGKRVGLAAAAWLAIHPMSVEYSQYARFYSELTFWNLLALGCGLRWIDTSRLRYLLGLVLASTASFYTSSLGSLFIGPLFIGLLFLLAWEKKSWKSFVWMIVAGGVMVVLYLPWYVYGRPGILIPKAGLVEGWRLLRIIPATFLASRWQGLMGWIATIIAWLALFLAIPALFPRSARRPKGFCILFVFLLGVVGLLAAIEIMQFFYVPRLLYPFLPVGLIVFITGADYGLSRLFQWVQLKKLDHVTLPIIVIVFALLWLPELFNYYSEPKACWKNLARFIYQNCNNPEKHVVYIPNKLRAQFAEYYYERMEPHSLRLRYNEFAWKKGFSNSHKTLWYWSDHPLNKWTSLPLEAHFFPGRRNRGSLYRVMKNMENPEQIPECILTLLSAEQGNAGESIHPAQRYEMGKLLKLLGRYEEIPPLFENYLEIKRPDDPWVRSLRSFAYIQNGQLKKAKQDVDIILQKHPDFDEALLLQLLFYMEKEPDKISGWLKDALPTLQDGRTILKAARALEKAGYLTEGLVCYRHLAHLEPDEPYHHVFVGRILKKLDRKEEALKAFQKARQLGYKGVD